MIRYRIHTIRIAISLMLAVLVVFIGTEVYSWLTNRGGPLDPVRSSVTRYLVEKEIDDRDFKYLRWLFHL